AQQFVGNQGKWSKATPRNPNQVSQGAKASNGQPHATSKLSRDRAGGEFHRHSFRIIENGESQPASAHGNYKVLKNGILRDRRKTVAPQCIDAPASVENCT